MPSEKVGITAHKSFTVQTREGDEGEFGPGVHLYHPEIPPHLIPDSVRNHSQSPDLTDEECHALHAESVEKAKEMGFVHPAPEVFPAANPEGV